MRPLSGHDAHGRRSSNTDSPSTFRLPSAAPMTFMIASEESASFSSSPMPLPPHLRHKGGHIPHSEPPDLLPKPRAGVASAPHHDAERVRDPVAPSPPFPPPATYDVSTSSGDFQRPVSPLFRSAPEGPSLSQPLTPILSGPASSSALSSMSSRRNSLCLSEDLPSRAPSTHNDDEVAVVDDDDEDDQEGGVHHRGGGEAPADRGVGADPGTASCSFMMDSGSAPQLVMPSIKMPSRRPFTEDGKRMGRLKVLIAGDSGVGKTTLVKAIVQSCEHIVHVDPINPSTGPSTPGARAHSLRRRSSTKTTTGTTAITEIYASTKPYPEWWSEVDDFRVLRRRKSLGDAVLDRNICFVDTPGYGSGSSSMDTIAPVAQYIEGHLQRISSNMLTDGDLLNLVGGEGGVQIDLVLYLVSNRLRPVDIEYLRHLAPLTNIIILLAQADLMSAEQVAASKKQIQHQLQEAEIRLFSFSLPSPTHPASENTDTHGIYAISSIAGPDHDTMDASLLMSPDYVQPLIPSELSVLVSHVFTPNGIAWLRHSVARKYVQWRKAAAALTSAPSSPSPSLPPSLSRHQTAIPPPSTSHSLSSSQHSFAPTLLSSASPTSTAAASPSSILGAGSPGIPATSYALARLADHTQREERLAQVRLANWAADLQRSLAREREEYARLARAERAMWLAERLGECVREGGLVVPPSSEREGEREGREGRGGLRPSPSIEPAGSGSQRQQQQVGRSRTGGGRPGVSRTGTVIAPPAGQMRNAQLQQQQKPRRGMAAGATATQSKQDPLGLLDLADDLRRKGIAALEVLGGIGVLGGLAVWVARNGFGGLSVVSVPNVNVNVPGWGWVVEGWKGVVG